MDPKLPPDYIREEDQLLLTLEDTVSPKHTALLVVDVQNDYVYGKGRTSTPHGQVNRCEEIIGPLNGFIDQCRAFGAQVIFTCTLHGSDFDLAPYKARKVQSQTVPFCLKGTKGVELVEGLKKPLPHESVIIKHGNDAFLYHNLNTVLQSRGIKTLIFSGLDTAVCVDTTLRHAFHLGYYVVLAADICTSPSRERHVFAVNLIREMWGCVTSSTEISAIWNGKYANARTMNQGA
jgi:ureidoacrylate peracid hydrolase